MDPEKVVEELTAEQAEAKKETELQVKAGSVLRLMLRANGCLTVSSSSDGTWASLAFCNMSYGVDKEVAQLLIDGGCIVEIGGTLTSAHYIVNSDFAESLERPETLTAVSRE